MISAEALAALGGLERGARYNLSHRTARELIDSGLAQPDWGHLGLTEAGSHLSAPRQVQHRDHQRRHLLDLSVHTMQIPPDAAIDRTPKGFWKNPHAVARATAQSSIRWHRRSTFTRTRARTIRTKSRRSSSTLPPEAPAEPLPIAESRMQEMLRAAGVAIGQDRRVGRRQMGGSVRARARR